MRQAGFGGKDRHQTIDDGAFHLLCCGADVGRASCGSVNLGPQVAVVAFHMAGDAVADDVAQAVHRMIRADDGLKVALDIGQINGNQAGDDGGFRGKIAVEVADAHAGRAGKVLHRGTVKALGDKSAAHRGQNLAAALIGLRGKGKLHGDLSRRE